MAGFDEAKFRQMAKEANYSDDEVESYIASQKQNAVTGKDFGAASTEKVNAEAQALRDAGSPVPGTEAPAEQQSTLQKFFDWVKTPAGTAAAGAAGVGISELARRKIRGQSSAPEIQKIEPTFTQAPAPSVPAPSAPIQQQPLPQATPVGGMTQQPALPQGYGQQTLNAPTGAPAVPPPSNAAPQPVAPTLQEQIQAERLKQEQLKTQNLQLRNERLQAPVKTAPASKAAAVPVNESDMQMIQKSGAASATKQLQAMEAANKIAPVPDPIQTTATPVEKQAAIDVVKSKPESVVKKPKAVVPPGMTKEEFGMMNHLLGTYGGKEEPMAMKAYEQVKDILGYTPAYPKGQGGSLTSEETGKILGWRKENIPGPKVNLSHDMKNVLKKGGPAAIAAMVLTPEFAKASTAEKRQIIGESLLPMGITPTELAPGILTDKQLKAYENAQKLGSPYRSVPPPR